MDNRIGKNIRKAREAIGMSQRELARKMKITNSAISMWESGKNTPNSESLLNLSFILQASVDELLGIHTYKMVSKPATLPLLGSIAAGTPIEAVEIIDQISVPSDVAERYPDAFVLQVKGDSMDKIIPDGSYVIVNPDADPAPHSIVAACINGYEATIKRYYKMPSGTVMLSPESHNPKHIEYVVHPPNPDDDDQTSHEKGVNVIGRVVHCFMPVG